MGRVLFIIIAISLFSSCSYWPHSWSEQAIRKIVKEEIQNEANNR